MTAGKAGVHLSLAELARLDDDQAAAPICGVKRRVGTVFYIASVSPPVLTKCSV